MKKTTILLFAGVIGFLSSCNEQGSGRSKENKDTSMQSFEKGSFGYDLDFLKSKDTSLIVLMSADSSAQIIVSAKYQGKVFTSTAEGLNGKSFGWVNHKAFEGPLDKHMNAYGGEDRLWLGPEGGKYSLFFKPGVKMDFPNWVTPAAIDHESWTLASSGSQKVSMNKDMSIQNYAGSSFQIKVERDVELLGKIDINTLLGIDPGSDVKTVAFRTVNSITNAGKEAWDEKTGAPCTWNLDMLMPSPTCTIVVPFIGNAEGKVATTDYFGEIAKDRINIEKDVLFFKADGKSRGKLGIRPKRVKNMAGSFDAENNLLTITLFDVDNNGKYLNQEWRTDRDPFSGDAMNVYNDGPLADGTQMGPFYEIESVSPAAFLKPGEKMTHHHTVFHFTGDKNSLSKIAEKTLGVSIERIENVFGKK